MSGNTNIVNDKSEKKNEKENNNNDENKFSSDDLVNNYIAEWSNQHEQILIEWGDKAICYRWLHAASHTTYAFKNRWFTVPVIIMSTLTGTANFAQERVPEDYQPMYSVIVGSINILAGIITTIQQFLKIGELNEAHRVSSISWDKFYRNIKLELGKSRLERMPPYQMLKISKEEFDRLMETSPSIDKKTVDLFNNTFSGGTIKEGTKLTEKQMNFVELYKPEICNVLESTKKSLYKETAEDIAKKNTKKLVNHVRENNELKRKSIIVDSFINNFNNEFKREPTVDEIHDNLKENISDDILKNIVIDKK
tara:strand:+ start:2355 stop:3281 length:927 start_codon:yes stop_codon:yes gene_type:complete